LLFPEKPTIKLPNVNFAPTKNIFIIAAIVFVLVLGGSFAAWWYLPKATVSIFVASKKLEEKFSMSVDTKANSANVDAKILPGMLLTTPDTGDKTKATTGTKLIGDKAKGSIKILNGTGSDINLAAGTAITSSGDLKYVLVSAVSVVAAVSTTEPGSANAEVAAIDIGDGYNLAKDERFKVSNYPKAEVEAISTTAFSGGSSREINAVAESDQKSLEEELLQELKESATQKLMSQLTEDKYFAEGSVIVNVKNKTFSAKVGDEATNLKLAMDVEASVVTIDKKIFLDFARSLLKERVPGGYLLNDDQIRATFEVTKEENGVYSMDTILGANLLPEVNVKDLSDKLAGRSKDDAENYLMTIAGFRGANIKFKPDFPGKLRTLPHVSKNINIEISAEK
jgi:hypothetical protein